MTKQSIKVVVTTAAGFSVTADDAAVAGQGTAAYGALQNHRDIAVSDGTNTTVIPYHALDHAVSTITTSTVADPADDVCPTTP